MMATLRLVHKGGEGSGFHGHAGRPGKVGGSSPDGVHISNIDPFTGKPMDKELTAEDEQVIQSAIKNVHEIVDMGDPDEIVAGHPSMYKPKGDDHSPFGQSTRIGDKNYIFINPWELDRPALNDRKEWMGLIEDSREAQLRHVVAHEYGHLWWKLNSVKSAGLEKLPSGARGRIETNPVLNDWRDNVWKKHRSKMSGYARYLGSYQEGFADEFSKFATGEPMEPEVESWFLNNIPTPAVEHKGGPGSGHYGHRGRPGKRGGSLPGGGVAVQFGIMNYANSIRQALNKNSPKEALIHKFEDAINRLHPATYTDAHIRRQAEDIVEVLPTIGREHFQRYLDKYGIEDVSEQDIQDIVNYDKSVDREVLRRIYRKQDELTFHYSGREYASPMVSPSMEYNDTMEGSVVGLVGNNYQDTISSLYANHGIIVVANDLVGIGNETEIHESLSTLHHIMDKDAVMRDIASRNVKFVRFSYSPGESYAARYNGTSNGGEIEVNLSGKSMDKFYGVPSSMWVHEMAHGGENDSDFATHSPIIDAGKRVSSYSWTNAMEGWAEAFTAWKTNYDLYKDYVPEKFAIFDKLYGHLK